MTEHRWELIWTSTGETIDYADTTWDRACLLAGKHLFMTGQADPTVITIQEQELRIVDHSGQQEWTDIGPACKHWFDCLTRRTL